MTATARWVDRLIRVYCCGGGHGPSMSAALSLPGSASPFVFSNRMNDRRMTTTASRSRGRVPTSRRCWCGRRRRGRGRGRGRTMGLSTWGAGPLLFLFCLVLVGGWFGVDRPAVALCRVVLLTHMHIYIICFYTQRRRRGGGGRAGVQGGRLQAADLAGERADAGGAWAADTKVFCFFWGEEVFICFCF